MAVFGQWSVPLEVDEVKKQLAQTEAAIALLQHGAPRSHLEKIRDGLAVELTRRESTAIPKNTGWRMDYANT